MALLQRLTGRTTGGILTVADDLLKNDGKKFIEMMEQLAERRMAREQGAKEQFSRGSAYGPPEAAGYAHNHPPAPEEDEYDEEEEVEDDYESQDEEFEDEEVREESSRCWAAVILTLFRTP
jgi:hypothetical protein